jgi:hypothetical protein
MLHLTSLHEASPKVMVNTQLGDCARVVRRRCACALGEIGLDVHLLQVHSVGRVTCEGMTVPVSDLLRMVDEVLRPRYGGSSLDYQWAEQEDRRGKGQLLLRVGPAVGPVDPPRMACDVLDGLAGLSQTGRIVAAAWREAGTVAIVREQPRQTVAGKTLPFMREAPS